MLDLELESVASKEYDPDNVPIRGNRFRRSEQITPHTSQRLAALNGFGSEKLHKGGQSNSTVKKEETNFVSKLISGRN